MYCSYRWMHTKSYPKKLFSTLYYFRPWITVLVHCGPALAHWFALQSVDWKDLLVFYQALRILYPCICWHQFGTQNCEMLGPLVYWFDFQPVFLKEFVSFLSSTQNSLSLHFSIWIWNQKIVKCEEPFTLRSLIEEHVLLFILRLFSTLLALIRACLLNFFAK